MRSIVGRHAGPTALVTLEAVASFVASRPCCRKAGMEIRDDALDGPLHPDLLAALAALVQPSLRLTRGGLADPTSPITRLGGLPLLATDARWPRSGTGEPLSLVGVWNTNEINVWYGDRRLPPDLVLSFFYDAIEQRAWGFDPAD